MKTWSDVEEAAYHDPLLRDLVTALRLGVVTREQGLIQVVLAHAEIRQKQFDEILRYVNISPRQPLIFKGQPMIFDRDRQTWEVSPVPGPKLDPTT